MRCCRCDVEAEKMRWRPMEIESREARSADCRDLPRSGSNRPIGQYAAGQDACMFDGPSCRAGKARPQRCQLFRRRRSKRLISCRSPLVAARSSSLPSSASSLAHYGHSDRNPPLRVRDSHCGLRRQQPLRPIMVKLGTLSETSSTFGFPRTNATRLSQASSTSWTSP